MNVSIHHLSLKVVSDRFDRTVSFYRDVMGLPIVRVQENAVFLSCGNTLLEILKVDELLSSVGILNHLAFSVDDVEESIRRVAAAGCQITRMPSDHTFDGEEPYRVHIAFFEGPAGESVELFREI